MDYDLVEICDIYVRLANPDEPERTMQITLDGPFWKRMDEMIF